jgi:hypothetical protein
MKPVFAKSTNKPALVRVEAFNGENILTVMLDGEWIAYDLTKEQASLVANTAVATLEKVGLQVQRVGMELLGEFEDAY